MNPRNDRSTNQPREGILGYMARNSVAANLLMILFVVGGLFVAGDIKQEVFPSYELDIVYFSMAYPGATPVEVEEGILFPAEEAVRGLDVVKRIESSAVEGRGRMSVELAEGVDPNRALQDINSLSAIEWHGVLRSVATPQSPARVHGSDAWIGSPVRAGAPDPPSIGHALLPCSLVARCTSHRCASASR